MLVLHTSSARETQAVAALLAALLRPGDLVALVGDLGAGKTTFTQGLARAMGVTEAVTSPTFTLHRPYQGSRLILHHLDVYRLGPAGEGLAGPAAADDLALDELTEGDTVTVIEWAENLGSALPAERLVVRLQLGEGDDDRTITLEPFGAAWISRLASLAEVAASALAGQGGNPC